MLRWLNEAEAGLLANKGRFKDRSRWFPTSLSLFLFYLYLGTTLKKQSLLYTGDQGDHLSTNWVTNYTNRLGNQTTPSKAIGSKLTLTVASIIQKFVPSANLEAANKNQKQNNYATLSNTYASAWLVVSMILY